MPVHPDLIMIGDEAQTSPNVRTMVDATMDDALVRTTSVVARTQLVSGVGKWAISSMNAPN